MLRKLAACFIFLTISWNVFGEEIDLYPYEKSLYSPNGEDGVIRKLFQLIQPASQFCVELGASDGVSGSYTYLLRLQGWDCLLLDRSHDLPAYKLHKEFITGENINKLLEKYKVPQEFDLLTIDLGYNDYHIWKALDPAYLPRVVLISYNATHLPHENKVVKYRPFYAGNGTNYFGASILALQNLGKSKGYTLVYAEKKGLNLFFVRNDILLQKELLFKNVNHVEEIYRLPDYGNGPNGGYPQDLKNQEYVTLLE